MSIAEAIKFIEEHKWSLGVAVAIVVWFARVEYKFESIKDKFATSDKKDFVSSVVCADNRVACQLNTNTKFLAGTREFDGLVAAAKRAEEINEKREALNETRHNDVMHILIKLARERT